MKILRTTAIALGALMVTTAIPAIAQDMQDELVVTGPNLRGVDTVSARVSYADLDIATWSGREELRYRVRETARDLCKAIRTSDMTYMNVAQCSDDAFNDAMQRVGTRFAKTAPRNTVWVASR